MFSEIKERVAKRLQGWKEKFLSKAGREVLIKAIAQAIPTYSMNCFLLPKSWCSDVDGLITKYWWGQTKNERKIHWLSKSGGYFKLHSHSTAVFSKLNISPHAPFLMPLWVLILLYLEKHFGGSEGFGQSSCVEAKCHGYYSCYLECYPSGMYSVQSGYTCLEADLRTLVEGESSCSQSRHQVWRKFWKLQLPAGSSDGMGCDLMGNLECMEPVHFLEAAKTSRPDP
uniref:Reverse transcriptase zinc-binding domain-containing protein n=1 Tax=Fagus sylvatica TaxID=28930 RepID=A0A2N9EYX1_FAGSY